jgi:hypothetical protein
MRSAGIKFALRWKIYKVSEVIARMRFAFQRRMYLFWRERLRPYLPDEVRILLRRLAIRIGLA